MKTLRRSRPYRAVVGESAAARSVRRDAGRRHDRSLHTEELARHGSQDDSYGAVIVSIRVPDRASRFDDVVIGHERLGYLTASRFFGAVIDGRTDPKGAIHTRGRHASSP
jgi:hypothetical protein